MCHLFPVVGWVVAGEDLCSAVHISVIKQALRYEISAMRINVVNKLLLACVTSSHATSTPSSFHSGSIIWYAWVLITIYSVVKVSKRLNMECKQIHCHCFSESAAVDFISTHCFLRSLHSLPPPFLIPHWRLQLSELRIAFGIAVIEQQTASHWLTVNHVRVFLWILIKERELCLVLTGVCCMTT